MVEYTCFKCNKNFSKKYNYVKHINKKKSCSDDKTEHDFENNTQHPQSFIAFPPQSTLWQNNWWNEYSPTCVDSQPDGWCDVDYPIPVQYFDYSPKAGTWWGHKLRGYLVEDNSGRGVILKSSCPVITLPFPGNSSIPGNGTSIPGNMSNPRGI